MLYNPKKQRGFLYYKLHSKKTKKAANQPTSTLNDDLIHMDQEKQNSLIIFLKNVVVSREENTLKATLLETVDMRREMIKISFDNYIQNCDFYFAAPRIVRIRLSKINPVFSYCNIIFSFLDIIRF